jgi:hypothetical protein
MKCVTANDMAGSDLNDQKSFRQALRDAAPPLAWHLPNARWKACTDREKEDMERVYQDWRRNRKSY